MLRPSKSTKGGCTKDDSMSAIGEDDVKLKSNSIMLAVANSRNDEKTRRLRTLKSRRIWKRKCPLNMQIGLFGILSLVFIVLHLHTYSKDTNETESHQSLLKAKSSTFDDKFENKSFKNRTLALGMVQMTIEKHTDDHSIIHIVNTRFMQHQPNLTTLATARLHLFKTFCLPSMINQSIQNFHWIIKIDPELDISIRTQLITLVKLYPNVYIVGSNENYMTGTKVGSWRGGQESYSILQNIQQGQVHTGNINHLRTIAARSNLNNIILETRLDADDGLNHRYLECLQKDALQRFQHKNSKNQITKWFFWCIEKHAKWYPSKDNPIGGISGERRLDFCITPGLTVGYNIGTSDGDVPYYPHHMLFNQLFKNKTATKIYDCMGEKCMTFITKMIAAVRSRTHTSAGMADVEYSSRVAMKFDMTNWIWKKLKGEFGVTERSVIEMHNYLQNHVKEIAKENLEGQCTDGHSCKKGSQTKLKQLIV